jgi:hypothetical protein
MSQEGPNYKKLILVPALITLGITLHKEAGGAGALLGIVWLAPIFGIYFVYRLAESSGSLWKNLFKTLFLYGLAARIPVIIVMGLAIFGGWGTHYDAFPPPLDSSSPLMQFLLGGVVTQLVVWAFIWTVGIGMLAAWIVTRFRAPKTATA